MLCMFHNSRARAFFEASSLKTSSAFWARDRVKMYKSLCLEKGLNFLVYFMPFFRISNHYRARASGKPVCPNYGSLGTNRSVNFRLSLSFSLSLSLSLNNQYYQYNIFSPVWAPVPAAACWPSPPGSCPSVCSTARPTRTQINGRIRSRDGPWLSEHWCWNNDR